MKIEELKNGDIVTLRNGNRLIYANEQFLDMSNENNNDLCYIDELNEDLTYDDNHEYDIAISDNNKDGKLTMNESIDISEYHYTRERLFIDAVLEGTSNQVATNTQDDISPDTPDYVNDANTTI